MDNKQLTFIDVLSILSFVIGLENLELNVDQNDMDEQTRSINKAANELVSKALAEIHQHLEMQDKKIDAIMEVLNGSNQKGF